MLGMMLRAYNYIHDLLSDPRLSQWVENMSSRADPREADFGTYLPVVILAMTFFIFAAICIPNPAHSDSTQKTGGEKDVIAATAESVKKTGTGQKENLDANPDKSAPNSTDAGSPNLCQACMGRKASTVSTQRSVMDDFLSDY